MNGFSHDGWWFTFDDRGQPGHELFVLLHGFPESAASWDGVAPRLVRDGFRVVALNQRGYADGARPLDVAAYRLPELAGDVLALVDAVGGQRFHLAGHDWGGFVAWYLAAHHPERLASVAVLSTPHPRAMSESMWRSLQPLRSWYALAWQVPVLPERLLAAADGRLLRAGLQRSGLPAHAADAYVARMLEPGALSAALNWYRASVRHAADMRSIGPIDVPTMYVWSTNDVALGRTAATRTGRHVAGPYRFVVLDGVSHWIPETEPQRVASLLVEHARSVQPS